MPGHELDRWKAYHNVEPLPDPAWSMAQICSVVATSMNAKGKSFEIKDFLPRVEPKKPRAPGQTPAEMFAIMRAATGRV